MAHVSVQMSQDQNVTAFHFFTTKRGPSLLSFSTSISSSSAMIPGANSEKPPASREEMEVEKDSKEGPRFVVKKWNAVTFWSWDNLLVVRHDPQVQTATTRDASVRRTASRVRSRSSAPAPAALGEVCEDGTRPRLAGLPACAPCLAAHVASTLYVVRHACQLTVRIPYPPCVLWGGHCDVGERPRWADSRRRELTVARGRGVGGARPPPRALCGGPTSEKPPASREG
eukprot:CAMPEP_0118847250 /NCGR_PEP_ID=MMETSP1162-20130426/92868_1 /TAXON_ID=33656 /ORGANISM="Phaeocystis Sp, Strain CCMP2710" /LENGTH=227 /DNA_ID=CAMNT_0006779441 /DNA_START=430 /DNA_END=1110 /DNA_ORIENTATION=+